MKNKKYFFLKSGIFTLVIFSFFFWNPFLKFHSKIALGNVTNIDISSLKTWQQNSGFRKNLMLNSKNSDVKLLQKALATDQKLYPEQKADGFLGKKTSRALMLFQKENDLSVTGIFDTATRKKMNEIFYGELCPVQTVEYSDFTDFTFLKNKNKLPDDFIPRDLKKITDIGVKSVGGIVCLRSDALEALKNMFDDAKKEGMNFAVSSGFRKPAIQEWLVNYYLSTLGEAGLKGIALPGYSEHQLGTAVDLTSSSIGYRSTYTNFKNTKEYKWLGENAGKYGFRLSYPIGNTEYIFEPWHYRFWGVIE